MAEFTQQSLREPIDAVRASRDALARTAEALRGHGASRLADSLDMLAANEDRNLALLLREQGQLVYRAGAIPEAPAERPAG